MDLVVRPGMEVEHRRAGIKGTGGKTGAANRRGMRPPSTCPLCSIRRTLTGVRPLGHPAAGCRGQAC
eukprot:scaffold5101_cov403-Prasinococcus_capsulatus_cf.AAC.5